MADSVKKVYIDSRYRDSGTEANFKITLPYCLNFSDNTKMYVDDIILPNSIKTINSTNDLLYLIVFYEDTTYNLIVQLTHNIYNADSFTTELQNKLNLMITANTLNNIALTVTYNYVTNLITITMTDNTVGNNANITIVTQSQLEEGTTAFGTVTSPKIFNSIIGCNDTANSVFNEAVPFIGYLDLHNVRAVYLTSSSLTNYDTTSNFNISGIIKKIPMRGGYNEIIFDNISGVFDFVGLNKSTISTIDFQLRDTRNNIIDLDNAHWSFTLIFVNLE